MRGTGSVSGTTRARVLDAIERLGYRPNATARNLVMRRTNLIGVVVGDVANAFDAALVKGIEQHGSARGYTTLVCNTDGHPERESTRIAALLEQRVDGIALLDFSGDRAVLAQLLAERVPVVMVSCWSDFTDCVAVDEYAGIALAVEHLAGLGHRLIVHATDPLMEATTRRERVQAFERAMLRSGLSPRADWTVAFDATGAELLALFEGDERPTAVVAVNDLTAIGVIKGLLGCGCRVPEDVSVTGFDKTRLAEYSNPSLTTVDIHRDLLGRMAADAVGPWSPWDSSVKMLSASTIFRRASAMAWSLAIQRAETT